MSELIKIKLAKTWGKYKKGAVIEVDLVRAKWLVDNDFQVEVKSTK